jgi:uncharacterized LabA/DUF88 family protein
MTLTSGPTASPDWKPRPQDVVAPRDRVGIFVDGEETLRTCREAGLLLDWGRLHEHFSRSSMLSCAYFYGLDLFPEDGGTRVFDKIASAGFVVRKQVQPPNAKKDARTPPTGDVRLSLAVDMAFFTSLYDIAFLFAGSTAYLPLIEPLRLRGKRVYIVTTRSALSNELRLAADKPIFFLDDMKEALRAT